MTVPGSGRIDPDRPTGPVAIGGVGGSGTRLVAAIVGGADVWLGNDVGARGDNRLFTLLFRRPTWIAAERAKGSRRIHAAIRAFEVTMTGRRIPPSAIGTLVRAACWTDLRRERSGHIQARPGWGWARVASALLRDRSRCRPWGWKEPNTHIVLPELADDLPHLRYVHVVRHGLDVAHGRNHNQLHSWGPMFDVDPPVAKGAIPKAMLRYWARANVRAIELGERLLPGRLLVIRYEDLRREPQREVARLLDFIGIRAPAGRASQLAALVDPTRPDRHWPYSWLPAAEEQAALTRFRYSLPA